LKIVLFECISVIKIFLVAMVKGYHFMNAFSLSSLFN